MKTRLQGSQGDLQDRVRRLFQKREPQSPTWLGVLLTVLPVTLLTAIWWLLRREEGQASTGEE